MGGCFTREPDVDFDGPGKSLTDRCSSRLPAENACCCKEGSAMDDIVPLAPIIRSATATDTPVLPPCS